jgi:hypothetical protein
MLCYSRSHGWRSLKPLVSAYQSFNSQALVLTAEVVDSSNQIHPCFKRFVVTSNSSSSSDKTRQALSKRSIESLDEGRVDDSFTLRSLDHSFNLGLAAFNDSPINADQSPRLVLLYGLRDEDSLPHLQARTTRSPCRHTLTKDLSNRADVSLQSICAEQDTGAQSRCTPAHLLNQSSYKSGVAAACYNSTQPQSGAYHHGHSHPKYVALLLNSKFIHLHLTQVTRSSDKLLVKRETMKTGTLLPTGDRSFVKREGSNNSLSRAAKRQQSDNLSDKLLRVAKTIKGAAFGFGKGLSAHRAFVATLFERVNRDVALKEFASGRTVHIRTKYLRRVQADNPFCFEYQIAKRIIFGPLFYSKSTSPRFIVELPPLLP